VSRHFWRVFARQFTPDADIFMNEFSAGGNLGNLCDRWDHTTHGTLARR